MYVVFVMCEERAGVGYEHLSILVERRTRSQHDTSKPGWTRHCLDNSLMFAFLLVVVISATNFLLQMHMLYILFT